MLDFMKRFKKLTLKVISKQIPFIIVFIKRIMGFKTISVISCPEIKASSHFACVCKGYEFLQLLIALSSAPNKASFGGINRSVGLFFRLSRSCVIVTNY